MINKIKKYKYQILELIIIFLITLIYNLLCLNLSGDEVWNYGFSYNISTGLIPYKDFNMIIPPFGAYIYAIPFLLFKRKYFMKHPLIIIIITKIIVIIFKCFLIFFIFYLLYLYYSLKFSNFLFILKYFLKFDTFFIFM